MRSPRIFKNNYLRGEHRARESEKFPDANSLLLAVGRTLI
jgi:hypothetical protein